MKKFLCSILVLVMSVTFLLPQALVYAENYNYGEALQKAIMFYEFQMAGKLPSTIRNNWRGDAALNDGKDVGLDLTQGWFDAGDHVKFNLPMAYTSAMLSWTVNEYKDALVKSGQLQYMLEQIKWSTDYFIKCHPEKYVYYYQVGEGDTDHRWWVPAEVLEEHITRPAYKVTKASGGSTVVAETAAALAAASLVFKDTDPTYASLCLQHAKDLFDFAEVTKSDAGYTAAANFYKSNSGFYDELSWAGTWIYLASGDNTYLDKAEGYVSNWNLEERTTYLQYKWAHCWDDVHYGAALLLARITEKPLYKESVERHLDYWTVGFNGDKIKYTPKGLAFLSDWGALRYATTTAYLASVYSDWSGCSVDKVKTYKNFAKSQVDYALGSTGKSFVVGFGTSFPQHPHHRTAHSSWTDSQNVPASHRHVLVGALVGGPDSSDGYTDSISDYVRNEVACDYNAGFVGALASMYNQYGGTPISNFTAIEKKTNEEIYVQATAGTSSTSADLRAYVYNKSGWPARVGKNLSFRYFMDLTEFISAGGNPSSITGSVIYSARPCKISKTTVFNAQKNIYYIEFDFTGSSIYPGGASEHQNETQIKIQPPSGVKWDNTNDFSYKGIVKGGEAIVELPVYDAGKLIFGIEPEGIPVDTVKIGDVNGDKVVDAIDFAVLKQYLLGLISTFPYGQGSIAADVNKDGAIDAIDYSFMKQYLLGKIDKFPAES